MPSEYLQRSQISRTLDESELAVGDKIDGFIASAAPVDLYKNSEVSLSYEWMKEDLAMRSAIGADLERQQRLAYEASDRKALAKQVDRQNRDDEETVKVLGEMNSLVQKGMPAAQARQEIFRKDPGRIMNPRLTKAVEDFGRSEFDEKQHELDRGRLALDGLKVALETNDLSALKRVREENPDGYESALRNLEKTRQLEAESGVARAEHQSAAWTTEREILELEAAEKLHEAKKASRILKNEIIDPNDFDKMASIAGTMDRFGLKPADLPKAVNHWNKSEAFVTMMADEDWMMSEQAMTEDEREQLSEALSKPGDPTADAFVLRMAGRHAYQRKSVVERTKAYEKRIADAEADAKSVNAFVETLDKARDIPAMQKATLAEVRPYLSVPGVSKLADEVSAAINSLNEFGAGDSEQKARAKTALVDAMGKFRSGLRQLGVAVQTPATSGPSLPTYKDIESLKSGDQFVGEDGKIYRKK